MGNDASIRDVPLPALNCPSCGTALPAGVLLELAPDGDIARAHPLPRSDLRIGRAKENDIVLEGAASVSRRHAQLRWTGSAFELTDLGSTEGTCRNERKLPPQVSVVLHHDDDLWFGTQRCRFMALFDSSAATTGGAERLLRLTRSLTSLDPREIVTRGLELLRAVSGVQRSLLVGSGKDHRLEPLLTPLSDPELHVSRSRIEEALSTGQKVSSFAGTDQDLTESMHRLNLRRVWVCPVMGFGEAPVAAVYLDSPDTGEPFSALVEADLESVVEHIGMALRNASLYAQVVELNQTLEQRVEERTRQLEDSQARLVAQDRLATLGRLVAAIAHELNNPVGAIASFARTLRGLMGPVWRLERELAEAFPDPRHAAIARTVLERALEAAERAPEDTRRRREREASLAEWLTAHRAPAAELLASRFARAGLDPADIAGSDSLLIAGGERLSLLAEQVHTFGRAVGTIEGCAGDMARIVNGLKIYSHLDRAEMERADIHRSIQATLSVLATLIPPGITVETRFAALEPIPHRPGELTQVWTNLVDNAVRSMGEQGTLTIETSEAGDFVRVTVADTGPGIRPEIADHIFDLHYTTRGPGAGLGLGLPICRAMIEKNHGGRITFASAPGRTVFTVEIPKRQPEPAASEGRPS